MAAPRVLDVATSLGPARLHAYRAPSARALVVLGHGAGRGTDTADLLGLAGELPAEGVAVVLVDQPWVLAGRKVAPAPAALDVGWREALAHVRKAAGVRRDVPLVVGGRSAGARCACRTALDVGAAGLLLLAFPLHPPGRPHAVGVRAGELAVPLDAGLPVVVAQGERDVFGGPAEVAAADPRLLVHAVAGADHSLRAAKGAPEPAAALLAAALAVVGGVVG